MIHIKLATPTQEALFRSNGNELDSVEEIYECPTCGDEYDNEDDASECCPRYFVRYKCAHCKTVHRLETDAEACHPFSEEAPLGVTHCRVCGKHHTTGSLRDNIEAAVDCCLWKTLSFAEREELARQMYTFKEQIELGNLS